MNATRPLLIAFTVGWLSGCGSLLDALNPPRTTVRLVNNADFEVRAVVVWSDNQNIPRDLLTSTGTRMEFTLAPREATSFTRECDSLQALIVNDAELRVIGQIGPHASSDVLRDGSEFDCRDTIEFTFDHSAAVVDFEVSVGVFGRGFGS